MIHDLRRWMTITTLIEGLVKVPPKLERSVLSLLNMHLLWMLRDKAGKARSNRSFEYDTPSNQYASFLEKEILPEVAKTVKLRTDAAGRAIGGTDGLRGT